MLVNSKASKIANITGTEIVIALCDYNYRLSKAAQISFSNPRKITEEIGKNRNTGKK